MASPSGAVRGEGVEPDDGERDNVQGSQGSQGTMDSLSGGTTNLLRMARIECRAAAAFVALSIDDDTFATATYPAAPDDEVTMPTVRGKTGKGFLRAGSNRPSAASLAFNCSNASCSAPRPAGSRYST